MLWGEAVYSMNEMSTVYTVPVEYDNIARAIDTSMSSR